MSDQPPDPDAAALVAADPFWSVVRRRHPDLDLVLLPGDPTPAGEAAPQVTLAEGDVTRLDEAAAEWWRLLADEESVAASRWVVGERRGVVRRESRFALEQVDPVTGTGTVERAIARLRAQGWRVLAPPDGLPRVLASHVDGAELQLVLAPTTGRLTLRTRSAGIPVGTAVAHELLTGAG